jgi:1,6-anhydro-N-acetylmuramate kinase
LWRHCDDQATPIGLGTAGTALWNEILGDVGDGWRLDARELHLLERACRCADELLALQAAVDRDGVTTIGSRGQTVTHPALAEARQLRLVQLRLLSALRWSIHWRRHARRHRRRRAVVRLLRRDGRSVRRDREDRPEWDAASRPTTP